VSAFHAILLVNDRSRQQKGTRHDYHPIAVEPFGHPRLCGFALIAVLSSLVLTRFRDVLNQQLIGTVVLRSDAARHGLDR
jgi:hypothetical protein